MWLKTTLETSITYSIPSNKNYSNSDRYSTLGQALNKGQSHSLSHMVVSDRTQPN